MPTIFTHAIAGVAIAQVLAPCSRRGELSLLAACCAMLPDADVFGFAFGIDYSDLFGHRGFTHSLMFAVLLGAVVTLILRKKSPGNDLRVFACIFVATISHGILDAFTNGGLGVAFFSPFDTDRYFFPLRPIQVSPIGVAAFLTPRGAMALFSEMIWVWPASIAVFLAARLVRCR